MTTADARTIVGAEGIDGAQPLLVLRPESHWRILPLKEIWQYKDLLTTLASRDVRLRYRQTALGAVWVVFQPLLGAGIFQLIFGLLNNTPTDNKPSFLFYFVGFMAYKAFENTLSKSAGSMLGNVNLVSKVYFPRAILPLSTVFSTLVDFGVSSVVLIVLMAIYHVTPTAALLLVPVWLLLLQMVALGIGFFTAALTVSYRDVQYVMPVLVQFGLYLAPVGFTVAHALTRLPQPLQAVIYINPLTGLIDAFRWSVLNTPVYDWKLVAYSAVVAVLVFIFGTAMFHRVERDFADVI